MRRKAHRAGIGAALLLTLALPATAKEPPPVLAAIARAAACLRAVDTVPEFAALRPRMPTAERMGVANIDDPSRPTPAQRASLERYHAATTACAPVFPDESGEKGAALAALFTGIWSEQGDLLRQLATGALTWGNYNRSSMMLDRKLRHDLAKIRRRPGDF